MSLRLEPGTQCVANGRIVQIDGPSGHSDMIVRDCLTGEMCTVPIRRIESMPSGATRSGELGHITKDEWDRSAALADSLRPFHACSRIPAAEIKKIARKHRISVRQVQRVRSRFQRNPRPSGLVRDRGGRRTGTNLLDPKVDEVVRHAIRTFYFRRERASKESVVRKAQSAVRRALKLDPPSRTAILARIRQMEGYECDRARFGAKKAKQKWEPRPGSLKVQRPLELIQIDHTPADVIVVTDNRLTELGRPWVTFAIDVGTRSVLGFYVAMLAPSSISVSLCIEHCVLPKPENDRYPGIWPMYGLPTRILVDNGKDFRSEALERGCREHGIELSFRPVRTPHYGAHIERLIGSMMRLTHELPGTTCSNVRERGDYDSAKHARLTLEEFRDWLVQKICREYHTRNHRELGVPPLIAWERGLTNDQGILVPPRLLANPLEFRMEFLPGEYRRVTRTGIEFRCSRYWHDDLAPLVGLDHDILVRYDPRLPGEVWVRRPDGVLVTVPAVAGPAAGEVKQRLAIDDANRKRLDDETDKGYEAAEAIVEQARRTTESARRVARKVGKAPPANPTLPLFSELLVPPPVATGAMRSQTWN
ncbi:MAG TPA: Mu transposase C-terminal domain-containing protein [Xanthomonadaceae bacterium]|jgi:putative transposase